MGFRTSRLIMSTNQLLHERAVLVACFNMAITNGLCFSAGSFGSGREPGRSLIAGFPVDSQVGLAGQCWRKLHWGWLV